MKKIPIELSEDEIQYAKLPFKLTYEYNKQYYKIDFTVHKTIEEIKKFRQKITDDLITDDLIPRKFELTEVIEFKFNDVLNLDNNNNFPTHPTPSNHAGGGKSIMTQKKNKSFKKKRNNRFSKKQ